MLKSNTPIEPYVVGGRKVWVKREDLCIDGSSFSKLRGVAAHILRREETVIGVLDTFHSKAGWGTAQLCEALCRKAVIFYPVYKDDRLIRGKLPVHVKNPETGLFESKEVCPPSGCLYCKEAVGSPAPCGSAFLQRATALSPSDYNKELLCK